VIKITVVSIITVTTPAVAAHYAELNRPSRRPLARGSRGLICPHCVRSKFRVLRCTFDCHFTFAWNPFSINLNPHMDEQCVFCQRKVPTRGHHVVPRCKGGREIAPTCHSCEDFIHKTWTHNELRDVFNTVEKIRTDERFQKFLRWLHKQKTATVFKSRRNRARANHKYR
jgi:hypothetical protein